MSEQGWKWRGRALTDLSDAEIINAHRTTCGIAAAMVDEMHRRGLFDKATQRAQEAEQEARRLRGGRA